jgi:drug/metabolite transporter (DMT)-like permease
MRTTSPYSRGYLIALSATLLWSFTGIIISHISRTYELPSLVLALWRDMFVALGLVVAFLIFSPGRFRLRRLHLSFMWLYGLVLSLFNSMWTFSVEFNGAAVATVLAFSSPAMTAILERLIFRTTINRIQLVSIVLSLAGTVLVSGAHDLAAWRVNAAGISFGLLTGFFFACYNMMGKASANKSIDSWTAQFYSFGIATCFLLLFNLLADAFSGNELLSNLFWLGPSWSGWGWLLLLGLGPTLGGYGLYTMSLKYLPATVSNLIATLEPALAAILAYFLLGEYLSGVQVIGSACILTGVILLRMGRKHRLPR